MGDYADDKINGASCQDCGIYFIDHAPGYPRWCSNCGDEVARETGEMPEIGPEFRGGE